MVQAKKKNGQASSTPPAPIPMPTPPSNSLVIPTVAQVLAGLSDTRRPGMPVARQNFNRSCVLDIETSDFSATGLSGFLICAVILELDTEKLHVLALREGEQHGNDKRLVAETIQVLSQFDNIIGHYIHGFDLPWLYTRADIHDLPPLRGWAVIDTYYLARAQKLRTQRKSQAFLLDHFGLENLKTVIYPRLWNDVRSNDPDLFKYSRAAIVDHCVKDVVGNRLIFDRIWPKAFATNQSPYKTTNWKGAAVPVQGPAQNTEAA
jgi:hypothetical protein